MKKLLLTVLLAVFTIADGESKNFETAAEAVRHLNPGWNLGNTLDAYNVGIPAGSPVSAYETTWGQPVTEEFLMKKVREKGFRCMRIPVTWFQHMDAEGNVDRAWMDRVEEVVGYVLKNDMYCILNVHHDTGAHPSAWIQADSGRFAGTRDRYERLWTQIATRFRDYDERLLFEGYNEMLDTAFTWSAPKERASLQAVNSYAQLFVNTVRATGGNNLQRNLVVTTYSGAHGGEWGNTPYVLSDFRVPTDPCGNQNHLAVEVHSYDPFDWVNTYNMTWTQQCSDELGRIFQRLNDAFISKGYPVIVGEFGSNGAGEKTINGRSTAQQQAEAGRQAADMVRRCRQHGAAAIYWTLLVDGTDRRQESFRWSIETVADSLVSTANKPL
jgi:aryl-phospho-beta-D-glucosidase BglC (GH1 family)